MSSPTYSQIITPSLREEQVLGGKARFGVRAETRADFTVISNQKIYMHVRPRLKRGHCITGKKGGLLVFCTIYKSFHRL